MAEVDVNDQVFIAGDTDKPITLYTGMDLLTGTYAYTDLTVRCRRPDATYFNLTLTSILEAQTGTIKGKFAVTDLTSTGMYLWQCKAVKGGQPTFRSDVGHFYVDAAMSGL